MVFVSFSLQPLNISASISPLTKKRNYQDTVIKAHGNITGAVTLTKVSVASTSDHRWTGAWALAARTSNTDNGEDSYCT